MSTEKIAACDVVSYDARKNIFVAAKIFVTVEVALELRLNGEFFRKVFCSPADLEDLTVGILAQAGKISSAADVTRLEVRDALIDVDVKNDLQPAQIDSPAVKFRAKNILHCADELLSELSTTHAKTNGVHGGVLFDGEKILLHREDIGRQNVFDKIHGAALSEKFFLGDKMIVFSGRCSTEMIFKLARMKIPAIAAKSVPTTHAVNLAKKFGITLAGRMTTDSFCIYTNPQRIVLS